MIGSSDDLDDLVLRIEEAFLDNPALALTREQASALFRLDEWTCAAVLGALVRAGIVTVSCEGRYVSWFPRLAGTPLGRARYAEPPAAADTLGTLVVTGRPA
jgi:hypothetical protein